MGTVPAQRDILTELSDKWGISRDNLFQVVKATVFRGDAKIASNEDLVAFLMVCNKYDLNPFMREIAVFVQKDKQGNPMGIMPMVMYDGWISLRNRHPLFNGLTFEDHETPSGNLVAVTTRIWLKNMDRPVEHTEYMEECKRDTIPWNKWPRRMLKIKSHNQAIRSAFGYSGIYDEDEVDRMIEVERAALPLEPLSVAQAAAQPPPPPVEPKAPAPEPPPIGEEKTEPPAPAPPPPATGVPGTLFPSTPVPPALKGHPRGGRS